MSSNAYWSYLKPDPELRLAVDVASQLLVAGGVVVVLTMSIGSLPRGLGAIACLAIGHREICRLRRGFRDCLEIRLAGDGQALVLGADGAWVPAALQEGSIVLQRLAWLRLRTVHGVQICELIRGDSRAGQDWRRLQVIWRHIGGSG